MAVFPGHGARRTVLGDRSLLARDEQVRVAAAVFVPRQRAQAAGSLYRRIAEDPSFRRHILGNRKFVLFPLPVESFDDKPASAGVGLNILELLPPRRFARNRGYGKLDE